MSDDLVSGGAAADQPFEEVAPRPAALIESMRSVGYTPQSAVADLVDNSLSAAASNVYVDFVWDGAASSILIRDDGRGMSALELSNAMRLGSRSPIEPRDPTDLGRFGLGLKIASFSQCRRLTVGSRRVDGPVAIRRWDLDYVTAIDKWRLLKEPASGSEDRFSVLQSGRSGTVVLWEMLDRVAGSDLVDDERAHRRFLQLVEVVENHLAMVFHRFLEGGSRLALWINGSRIEPWDPFLSREPATQRLAEETLLSEGSRIEVRPYVLPHHSKISSEVHRRASGPAGWNAQQGFYIYRGRRLLVAGDWLRLGFEKEEHSKLARIQVDLPNGAEEAWSIDVKKSTARPPGALRDEFRRIAIVTRRRAREVYGHRGKVIARGASAPYSFLWSRVLKHGKISYRVNRDHPIVKRTMETAEQYRGSFETLLRTVEETVPAPQIALDLNQTPDAMAVPFEGSPTDELLTILRLVYRALRREGMTDPDARARLLVMEPFAHHPEIVASFDEAESR